jgi:hypothetical protein
MVAPGTVPDRWRRADQRRKQHEAAVVQRAALSSEPFVRLAGRRRLAFQPFGVALVFMATAVLVVAVVLAVA